MLIQKHDTEKTKDAKPTRRRWRSPTKDAPSEKNNNIVRKMHQVTRVWNFAGSDQFYVHLIEQSLSKRMEGLLGLGNKASIESVFLKTSREHGEKL